VQYTLTLTHTHTHAHTRTRTCVQTQTHEFAEEAAAEGTADLPLGAAQFIGECSEPKVTLENLKYYAFLNDDLARPADL